MHRLNYSNLWSSVDYKGNATPKNKSNGECGGFWWQSIGLQIEMSWVRSQRGALRFVLEQDTLTPLSTYLTQEALMTENFLTGTLIDASPESISRPPSLQGQQGYRGFLPDLRGINKAAIHYGFCVCVCACVCACLLACLRACLRACSFCP